MQVLSAEDKQILEYSSSKTVLLNAVLKQEKCAFLPRGGTAERLHLVPPTVG